MKKILIISLLFVSVILSGQKMRSTYFSGLKLPSNDIVELARMSIMSSSDFEKEIVTNLQFKKVGYEGESIMFQKGDAYTKGGGVGRLMVSKNTIKMIVEFTWQCNIYVVQEGNSKDFFQKTLESLSPYYKETKHLEGNSMTYFEVPIDEMLFSFSFRRTGGLTFLTVLRMG
jgi:hypothetical protein